MIDWQDHYLWAGLIVLCVDLIHFALQRKLRDLNTVSFFRIISLGLLVCGLGILMSAAQNRALPLGRWPVLLLASCSYLVYALLPYELLRFISTRLPWDGARRRLVDGLGLIPVAVAAAVVLLNLPLELLSAVSADGRLALRSGDPFYVNGLLLYYLFDVSYLWAYRRELGRQNSGALLEACVIMMLGLFAQHYLRVQMFFGLPVALAVTILHLALKNPNAYIDPETQVFNARYFAVWMGERLAAPRRGGLVAVELYQMEQISRLYADGTERALAAAVAAALWELDPCPHVFQLDRGRFALWTGSESRGAGLLQQCGERLSQPFQVEGVSIRCPAALAQISLEGEARGVDELTAYLTFCLQQAHRQGQGQVVRDSPALRARFDYEVEVDRYLEQALDQDLFQVWYQPVYSLERNGFVALEALSRLRHPKLGWIPPDLFIRLAGHRGLLTQIMPRQLRRVCQFAQGHMEMFQTIDNIKIDLSPQELADPDYCRQLLAIIGEHGLPASWFQFEVTESAATQYTQELERCVAFLEQMGVGLCLDDFGSGYANLNTVMRLPFSVIKLDRSLLSGICEDPAAAAFYRDMVAVLEQLGYTVVAEGVESWEQVQLLSSWRVDQIQGFYYARPLPPEQAADLIVTGARPAPSQD